MPFIVSWPGTIKPGRSDAIISQMDLFASFARLTGATVPAGAARDSRDLLDTLLGRTETGRDHVIQQGTTIKAIRHGDWKYIPPGRVNNRAGVDRFVQTPIAAPGALYFLPEDPQELNNVATLYPEKARELRAILEAELGRSAVENPQGDTVGGAVQK
jgi:arylsulfatase A-like enzyme